MIKTYEFLSVSYKLFFKKKPIPGYYIFTLHQVSKKGGVIFNQGTNTKPKDFIKLIELLKQNFKIISMTDFLNSNKKTLSEAYAILTFDDGDESCENIVYPILKQQGIPATFFINTYTSSTGKLSWSFLLRALKNREPEKFDILRKDKDIANLRFTSCPNSYIRAISKIYEYQSQDINYKDLYVTESFLEKLDKQQFTIGNHGHEHHRYGLLNYESQYKDFIQSKNYLESFGAFLNLFAVPFGRTTDFNSDTLKLVKNEKSFLFTSMGGTNIASQNLINRIPSDNLSYELLSFKYF